MSELSETIERKYIETIDLDDWEIETDTGWEDISSISQTIEYDVWEIKTEDGSFLRCADNHIIFDDNYNQIFVKDCIPGQTKIITKSGSSLVTSIVNTNQSENMYDISVDSDNHRFWSNDILSHNSTTTCAFILWYILFHQHRKVAILADKGETAREILSKVKLAYSMIPKWMQSGIPEGGWNKGTILLENGSVVFAAATSSAAIRGYSINLLFLDEVAHVEGWEEFESAVLPTISSSKTAKVIMVSTPKGMNHFYKYWTLANKSKDDKHWNGYHPIHVNWNQVPGRDQKWYEDMLNTMSGNMDKFNQEFGVEFLGSTDTLIAGWKLKELVHVSPLHYEKGLSQYFMPVKGHQYIIVADTSHGKGQDDSAFHCIDITEMPYRIAATFKSNQTVPYEFTDIMTKTALAYNRAWILAENNDVGQTVNQLLQTEFAYDGMLYSRSSGRNGKALSAGFQTGAEPGIRTTTILKIQGCSHLKLLIEQNQLIVEDLSTIEELSTFVKDGPSYKADKNVSGSKDDLVMALVIFAWATDQLYFKELSNINTVQHLRDNTDIEMEQMLTPFGIHYDSAEEALLQEERLIPAWHSDKWKEMYIEELGKYELSDDQLEMLRNGGRMEDYVLSP